MAFIYMKMEPVPLVIPKILSSCWRSLEPGQSTSWKSCRRLSVLFSNDGYSSMCFFTNRFNSQDIIGRSIIIHENPDDYRTQPAGNSGKRLACGVIKPL